MWKNMFFSSGNCKKGLQVYIGKWKRPFEQVAWGETNLAITFLGKGFKHYIQVIFDLVGEGSSLEETLLVGPSFS